MATTSTPTHLSLERETQYKAMLALYHPPKTLRKSHKDYLKTAWSIKQGYDGTKLRCDFCQELKEFADINVHHKDGDEEHNDPDNLCPACWKDNQNEKWIVRRRKKAEVVERERELKPPKFEMEKLEGKASSSETARAERMRPRWDDWIAGRITRPSMLDHPCQIWSNTILNIRDWCDLEQISERAPAACQLGSSKTYWKYGKEDIQAGKFERENFEGKIMVRYNPEFAGMVAANLNASLEKFKEAKPQIEKEAQK